MFFVSPQGWYLSRILRPTCAAFPRRSLLACPQACAGRQLPAFTVYAPWRWHSGRHRRPRWDRLRLCRRLLSPDGRRGRLHGWSALCKQRLILQFVEIATLQIAPSGLPTLNRAARGIAEVAIGDSVEVTQRRQSPLNITAFKSVEPELLLGLACRECGVDRLRNSIFYPTACLKSGEA